MMHQTHMHKAVTGHVVAKKLLSRRVQLDYSLPMYLCSLNKLVEMCIKIKPPGAHILEHIGHIYYFRNLDD